MTYSATAGTKLPNAFVALLHDITALWHGYSLLNTSATACSITLLHLQWSYCIRRSDTDEP